MITGTSSSTSSLHSLRLAEDDKMYQERLIEEGEGGAGGGAVLLQEDEAQVKFYAAAEGESTPKSHSFVLTSTGVMCSTNPTLSVAFASLVGCKKNDQGTGLSLYAYRVVEATCFSSRHLKRFMLRIFIKAPSEAATQGVVNRWHAAIKWMLREGSVPEEVLAAKNLTTAEDFALPPNARLMVLVNPSSGVGNAESIWAKAAQVICEEAECEAEVISTERQFHALEYLGELPELADRFDSIVIVSGDGLVYEVLQGIMSRQDWVTVVQKVSIGIIPGGSGNGLAVNVARRANLPIGVATNAFIVAKQQSSQFDVCAVDVVLPEEVKRVYTFLSLEWGLNSFLDIDSERARCLGSARFTLWAVLGMVLKRAYKGRLSYLPPSDEKAKTPVDLTKPELYWSKNPPDSHAEGEGPITSLLPNPKENVPEHWSVLDGTFYSLLNCNLGSISQEATPAPETEGDDGHVQMLILRAKNRSLGRLTITRWLLNLESGEGYTNKPYGEMIPSKLSLYYLAS